MYTVKPGDVVLVKWEDACGDESTDWQSVTQRQDDIAHGRVFKFIVLDVGIVVALNDTGIYITSRQAVGISDRCGPIMMIPWAYIQDLWIYEKNLVDYS